MHASGAATIRGRSRACRSASRSSRRSRDGPTPGASTAYRDRVAAKTSTQTTRLLAAGCVPVGLTASPELGMLPITVSVLHGTTRNPWDLTRTPAGSSGGSGAALAAGLVPLATGSDMGGSIRMPASVCGVVGIKGTFGLVSRAPRFIGLADLVHFGPLARSVADAARYLDCVAGEDERDPTALPAPGLGFERAIDQVVLAGRRITVAFDNGITPTDPDVATAVSDAVDALCAAAAIARVDGPTFAFPSPTDAAATILALDADPAEAWAMGEVFTNLMQTPGAAALLQHAFGGAATAGMEGVGQANVMRAEINAQLAAAFDQVDLLAFPTTPTVACGAEGPLPEIVAGRERRADRVSRLHVAVQPVWSSSGVGAGRLGRRTAGGCATRRPPPPRRLGDRGRRRPRARPPLAQTRPELRLTLRTRGGEGEIVDLHRC